jgi:hypothetical protein
MRVIEYDPGTVSFFFLPPSFIGLCPPLSLGAFSRTCVRICGCCGGWVVVAWGPQPSTICILPTRLLPPSYRILPCFRAIFQCLWAAPGQIRLILGAS